MSFPFNAYLLAFAGSLVSSLIAFPFWHRWCLKTGLVDQPGHRKIHSTPIPLAGGLAVLTGFLAPIIGGSLILMSGLIPADWTGLLTYGLDRRSLQLAAIIIGAVAMTTLGWWDDRHTLRPLPKFAGQLLIAAIVAASGVRITLFVDNVFFSYATTILWILTLTNSLNFLDNMNGLCAGLGISASFCFAMAAAARGQYLVAILAFLISGALLGFLPFNYPRAKAFLGDAGSHLVGYLLAILAILPHFYTATTPNKLAVLSPLLVLSVPIYDIVTIILIRLRLGKPVYEGDTNHVSHRLVRKGLSKPLAVAVLWLCSLATGAISLLL